ncbi:MAG: ligand-binding protein SH3 [Candidatus Moranbacteria bacterium]|nr:ligand-binding protein SH3 [Candidatus Moranbacteria bacterium]
MTDHLIEYLSNLGLSGPAVVLILAMLPVSELRGAIPAGILIYQLSPWLVFFLALIGNLIPVFFILVLLKKVDRFLRQHSKFFSRILDWVYARTRKKGQAKIKKSGLLALVLIVAIPMPFTGAWTGAVLASLLDIPIRKAFPLIALGVFIAAIAVILITLFFNGII